MNRGAFVHVLLVYLGIALTVAAAAFVVADRLWSWRYAAPDRPGQLALLAGMVWPVVLIGAVQVGLWMMAVKAIRSKGPRQAGRERAGADMARS